MRKIVICGARWCTPCKHVLSTLRVRVEQECPGTTEYIDLQEEPQAIDKYKVYKIPMVILEEDGKPLRSYVGTYPNHLELVRWVKGEKDDRDI